MSHLPPSTPLASKSPRKTKLGLTEAEKQIMAALSEVPNSSPGDLPVGNGRGRESMMPPKKKAPSQEELNIVSELDAVAPKVEPLNNSNAVRKSMYPVRNNVPQQALEPSPQVERKSMQPLQHNVPQPNYYKQVIANNSHSENDGAPNKEEPQAVPKSRFGRVGQQIVANSVDPPNRNLSANRSPIAPENPGAHKVDSGSPKIQIVEQQSPVSIEVVGSSDDEEMVSPLPKPEFQRKRSSVFGTAIQPEAHRAASKKRQSSIGRGGSINRRANDVFGFDQGLGGVGPTELLDLRKAPLEKKKSEPRND